MSINERHYPSGSSTIRVRLRRRGKCSFYITFDDWNAACNWVEDNEEKFYENPEHFYEWKQSLYREMIRKRLMVMNHIVRPKLKM